MPFCHLPNDPSLEHLQNEAKTLQRQVRAGAPEALEAVREHHPRPGQPGGLRLADAQLVVARTYGFPSWARLRRHLETVARYSRSPHRQSVGGPIEGPAALADEFLRLACLTYGGDEGARLRQARELLAAQPQIASESIHTMAAVGNVAAARALLATDPSQARREGGPHAWEPLLYLAYSRLDSTDERHSTVEVARLLLRHGADSNAGYLWAGLHPFTALTGAFGGGEDAVNQPPHQHQMRLARLLLEAGADPNDSQALYNRQFNPSDEHLELLFAFGLGHGDGGPWHARLAPAHPTPQQMLEDQLLWAARSNMIERVRLLLRHVVDVDGQETGHPVLGRRTAYAIATRDGNAEVAELLREAGATQTPLDPVESLLAACMRADRAEAAELLAADPALAERAAAAEPERIIRAAELGRRDAVRLMAELGFDVNVVRRTTALHGAASAGDLEMVKLLLELGADPSLLDTEFCATPLGWAEHNQQHEVAEYLAERTP
jgi:ankyrin repeat protein